MDGRDILTLLVFGFLGFYAMAHYGGTARVA